MHRRTYVKTAGVALGSIAIAGCAGDDEATPTETATGNGNGNGDTGSVRIPGFYDLGGPSSTLGVPYSRGVRDVLKYTSEEDVVPVNIDHPHRDNQYNPEETQRAWEEFTKDAFPPAIVGWGTPSAQGLGQRVAENEVVMVSAAASALLHQPKFSYNFFANLDYTSQVRIGLHYINEQDPGAHVGLLRVNDPFGTSVEDGAYQFAEELDIELADPPLGIELTASNAESQARRAREEDFDWLVCQTDNNIMAVVLNDLMDIYPDVNVLGTGWSTDERAIEQMPDAYEGVVTVSAYNSIVDVAEGDSQAADVINTAFGEYHDNTLDDKDIANFHYMSGMANAITLVSGIENVANDVDDLSELSGSQLREGVIQIDGSELWGTTTPVDYRDDDRRATMTGNVYQIQNSNVESISVIELERRDEWLGV